MATLNSEVTQIEYNVQTLSYTLFLHIAGSTTRMAIDHDTATSILDSFSRSNTYKVVPSQQLNVVYYEVQKSNG